ncbi:MAG TPA: rod shape-determining protein MreC [Candidatus Paceibacterota bacterium]|nr:rod shape-determining protein MreC [Candidatus Paceibacterota bacterium]
MNLQSHNRGSSRTHYSRWYTVFIFIAVIILFTLFRSFWLQIFYDVSTPFVFVKNSISSSFGNLTSGFQSSQFLAEQNSELKQDIDHLNTALLSMQALETENTSLSKMVGNLSAGSPRKTVIAQVLFAPPSSPYDTLIIQAGVKDAIAVGNPVFADDGTPIGTIAEVDGAFSKVSLYSSPGTSLSVIVGKEHLDASAIGEGSGNFSMKIPVADAPSVGDAVYMPQFQPTALGAVSKVSFAPSDSFATVLFSFPTNIFTLSYVTIDTSITITNTYAASAN